MNKYHINCSMNYGGGRFGEAETIEDAVNQLSEMFDPWIYYITEWSDDGIRIDEIYYLHEHIPVCDGDQNWDEFECPNGKTMYVYSSTQYLQSRSKK